MQPITPRSWTVDMEYAMNFAFEDKLLLSQEFHVPILNITKTDLATDRRGIDYFVTVQDTTVSIDMKRRRSGIWQYWRSPTDPDLNLELWSDKERKVPGQLFRPDPLPDLFAYYFADLPGQLYLVPGEPLRAVIHKHWDNWARDYGIRRSHTQGKYAEFVTEFLPTPFSVIATAMTAAALTLLQP